MNRVGSVERNTKETQIKLNIDLDGSGVLVGNTGIGFFDHMLELLVKHSNINLDLEMKGDLEVDAHHSVEDVGIALGEAFKKALGDKAGIERYGSILLPMDEVLVLLALDLSGRPYLNFDVTVPYETIGNFETELVEEFFRAFIVAAGINLHVKVLEGRNTHHIIEGMFKALGRSLKMAIRVDERNGIPSTKGMI